MSYYIRDGVDLKEVPLHKVETLMNAGITIISDKDIIEELKQQLEAFKSLAETNKKLGDKYFEQLKEAVEVIEIAQKRIKKNPEHLVITQGDLINNKWHERARQFLAKYLGEK